MNTKTSSRKFPQMLHSTVRALGCYVAVGVATIMLTIPAQAAFHLWAIQEIYTDSSGTLQFIEFSTASGSQQFVGGQSLNAVSGTTHTFTIPSNLPSDSFNHTFLIGTAGIQAAGGPTPDYIMANNFLFTSGGTINFWLSSLPGVNNPLVYSALPTDGSHSRITFGGSGDAINSPQNFAGQTGTVVPEPTTSVLFGLAGFGLLMLRRRSA